MKTNPSLKIIALAAAAALTVPLTASARHHHHPDPEDVFAVLSQQQVVVVCVVVADDPVEDVLGHRPVEDVRRDGVPVRPGRGGAAQARRVTSSQFVHDGHISLIYTVPTIWQTEGRVY